MKNIIDYIPEYKGVCSYIKRERPKISKKQIEKEYIEKSKKLLELVSDMELIYGSSFKSIFNKELTKEDIQKIIKDKKNKLLVSKETVHVKVSNLKVFKFNRENAFENLVSIRESLNKKKNVFNIDANMLCQVPLKETIKTLIYHYWVQSLLNKDNMYVVVPYEIAKFLGIEKEKKFEYDNMSFKIVVDKNYNSKDLPIMLINLNNEESSIFKDKENFYVVNLKSNNLLETSALCYIKNIVCQETL